MKKYLSILLALLLLLGVFAGCGSSPATTSAAATEPTSVASEKPVPETTQPTPEPKDPVTITWLSNKATDRDFFEAMFSDFKEETGITVQTDYIAKDYNIVLPTKIASGDAPDTFQVFPDPSMSGIFGLARKGLLLDLTNEAYMSTYLDSVLSQLAIDGKYYSVATSMNVLPVMYNKKLFAQAGIEKVPENIVEFMDVCAKLKENGIAPMASTAKDRGWFFETFAIAPTTVFGKTPDWQRQREAGTVTYAGEPGWEKAFSILNEMYEKGYIIDKPLTYGVPDAADAFAKGNVAMWVMGNWQFGNVTSKGGDALELGAFFFPANEPGEEVVWAGSVSEMFAASANTKYPEESKALIGYFSKRALEMSQKFNGFPTVKGAELENPIPAVQELLPVINNNKSYTFLNNEWPAGCDNFVIKGAQAVMVKEQTIDEVLKDADVQYDQAWQKLQQAN